jgi:hypothetical protein
MYNKQKRSEEKWVIETMTGQEQCIRQLVQIVETNVKYHSNQQKEGQSTVENAIKNIDHRDEIEDISKPYLIS